MTQTAVQRLFAVENIEQMRILFGGFDENIKVIMEQTGADIAARDTSIVVTGEEESVELACQVMDRLLKLIARKESIDRSRIRYAVELAKEGNADMIDAIMQDVVAVTHRGKQIRCKTLGQRTYVKAMKDNTVVFSIGPAGTGKTYLAMAVAVAAYKNKEIERIVLTRPAAAKNQSCATDLSKKPSLNQPKVKHSEIL